MAGVINKRKIGRFEIVELLGKGSQSEVYLAFDPHLQRRVAIKTVHFEASADRANQTTMLLKEARTVSKLQHPNIVPIFEAGEEEDVPYLVFEYIEGETLADLLRREGGLPVSRALDIVKQVLDSIEYAHGQDIVHRDLKPSNILMNKNGIPRVMDFGIASRISDESGENGSLMGTPSYMAPEYIAGQNFGPQSDLFAVGLILHEMLTGKKAIRGNSVHNVLSKIVNEPIAPPSQINSQVDEKLDDLVMKALAKDPQDRIPDAGAMKAAIDAYLKPAEDNTPVANPDSKQATLEFLLRRMRHKSDFPALSEAVSSINKIASSDQESVAKLSGSILKDVALTNKLLKLVNSVFYRQVGGGTISTVSRAVLVLGFDAVRNLAVSLVLFEHMQNKGQAAQLKDEFARALFTGMLAKEMAGKAGVKDAEEGFICAMFHNLGRMLAMFYFMDENEEIKRLVQQTKCTEAKASAQVLGLSYEDLGIGIARSWGFPEQLTMSMKTLGEERIRKPSTNAEKLRVLSGFSNELSDAISSGTVEDREKTLRWLNQRFGDAVSVSEKHLESVVKKALDEIVQYSSSMRLNLQQSPFSKQANKWAGKTIVEPVAVQKLTTSVDDTDAALAMTALDQTLQADVREELKPSGEEIAEENESAPPADAQGVLMAGLQDISSSLIDEKIALNDILRMILETMYRGMGFHHVLLCIKDGRHNSMNARFGFGQDIEGIIKRFKFPLSHVPDVFHIAMEKNADILISDIEDGKIKARIPEWFKQAMPAQTFVLFPVVIKGKPIALIYADKRNSGDIRIPEGELSLLKALRNQAVLAIKQSL